MLDWKRVLVGALAVTFLAFFTGPFTGRYGTGGASWVESVLGIQLGGTVELALFLVLVVVVAAYKIYEWIPSRGEKRSWVPEE